MLPEERNSGLETTAPITLGDNVWLGGDVTILPGVTIGSNTVIGAGSVVTKDIPSGVVAVGNPCKAAASETGAGRGREDSVVVASADSRTVYILLYRTGIHSSVH